MSRIGRLRAVVALMMLAVLPACDSDPEETMAGGDSAQRLARLQHQADEAERLLSDPPPWLAALPEFDRQDRTNGGGYLSRADSERVIWDRELIDLVVEPLAGDRQSWRGPLATVVAFAEELQTLQVDLLVVPIPPRAAVLPAELIGAEAAESALYDGHFRRFLLALEEHGIETVDLLPALQTAPYRDFEGELPEGVEAYTEAVFRRQDSHWTTYGSGLAATAIAERVRRFDWFAEVAQAQGSARLVTEIEWKRRLGPIARRLQRAGSLSADTEPERYPRRWVRIVGERWSFEDRRSPVLVIGDSFVQPQHGLVDGLLEELGFRVDRIGVSGEIPSGALTALAYRGDQLRGKRLVIWVFASYSLNRWKDWQPVSILSPDEGG